MSFKCENCDSDTTIRIIGAEFSCPACKPSAMNCIFQVQIYTDRGISELHLHKLGWNWWSLKEYTLEQLTPKIIEENENSAAKKWWQFWR